MTRAIKYTTDALNSDQHLKLTPGTNNLVEAHFEGFTKGKYDKTITGFYYFKEVRKKPIRS